MSGQIIGPIGVLPAGGGAYTGPGNIVAGATAWYGIRAYSSASIGNNAVELRESGGNTLQTFATIAGGGLDLAAIATFKGANNLFVRRLFDQSGNGNPDMLQATNANQPSFTLAALGALPVIHGTAGFFLNGTAFASTVSNPWTVSCIIRRNSSFTTEQDFFGAIDTSAGLVAFGGAANQLLINAGSSATLTQAGIDSNWLAVQFVGNGTSSDINLNGTVNTVSAGTAAIGKAFGYFNVQGFSGVVDMDMNECGIWSTAFSSGQSSSMSSNQHAYWGF